MAIKFIKKALDTFWDLLCPAKVTCLLCSKEIKSGDLCADCEKNIVFNGKNRCEKCSRPTVSIEDNLCEQCKKSPVVYFDKAVAPFVYTGTALMLIRALKYHDRRDIAKYFAPFMKKEYDLFPKCDILLPVPMHESKYLDRLYNQSSELARELGLLVGKTVREDICVKTKNTGTQTVLKPQERVDNVKGSFKVVKKEEIKDKSVVIIDDVFTTGATVSELARVLKKAGASKVYVICTCIAK